MSAAAPPPPPPPGPGRLSSTLPDAVRAEAVGLLKRKSERQAMLDRTIMLLTQAQELVRTHEANRDRLIEEIRDLETQVRTLVRSAGGAGTGGTRRRRRSTRRRRGTRQLH